MKHGNWNVVWQVTDRSDEEHEITIGVYADAEKAASVALNHPNAPMVGVEMQLYKDEWMTNVIK